MDDDAAPQPEPPDMAWLLTFADLVSLLITFFVLLYSMKTVDQSKWDMINGSFRGVFADREALVMVHPEDFRTTEVVTEFQADSLRYLQSLLRTEFYDDPVLANIQTEFDEKKQQLIISLPSTLLFTSGSSELRRDGRLAVIKLADKLRHLDNNIEVAGHTDPSPSTSIEYPTNWELAMLRAIAVARIMYERGVDQTVPAFSYGDSRFEEIDPFLPEAKRYMRARRVDVIVLDDKDA